MQGYKCLNATFRLFFPPRVPNLPSGLPGRSRQCSPARSVPTISCHPCEADQRQRVSCEADDQLLSFQADDQLLSS